MDRHSVDWRGYIPAITTPFDKDGTFRADLLVELLEWLHGEGMHGLVVAGTTGEWYAMTPEEKSLLYRTAGDTLKGKLTLIAGCSAFTADGVLDNAREAAAAGFDGILVTPPPYVMPSPGEVLAFYRDINAGSPLPICIYNWPPGTNIDMSLELLTELAALDNVVAIKNSTGNFGHFLNTFFALKDQVRIFGVPMNEIGASLVEHHGADGMMGAGAVLGRDQPRFFDCIWEGNTAEALKLGAKDRRIMSEWFTQGYTAKFGSAPAILKAALNVQGLPGGYPRKPILPVAEQHVQEIARTLKDLGRNILA